MNYKFLFLLLLILITPVIADVDTFTLKTVYTPTEYTIDYGLNYTAKVTSYSINSTYNLTGNQSWFLAGSNNQTTIDNLDIETNLNFTENIERNFFINTPDYYKYYYLVLLSGFDNSTNTLILKLTSTSKEIIPHIPNLYYIPIPIINDLVINETNITSTQINWYWSNTYTITNISIDGEFIKGIDYTVSNYILSNLNSNSYHSIKIFSGLHYGELTSKTLPETETNQESFFRILVGFILILLALECILIGIETKEKLIGLLIICLGFLAILTSIGNSFIIGMLAIIILIVGFFISFGGD